MDIPLYPFLIAYGAFLLAFIIMGFINAYHIGKFGTFDSWNTIIVIIFFTYSVAIIVATLLYLLPVDWTRSLTVPFINISTNSVPVL